MISIGFPGDEDDRIDEVPCCDECGHEMGEDLFGEWYCVKCAENEKMDA
jgi:hypothetical protein